MFDFINLQYRMGRLTAAQVWRMADTHRITEEDAEIITGAPRLEAKRSVKK